jgi:hypothetical protein
MLQFSDLYPFGEKFLQNLELRNWKGISAANSLFFWKSFIKLSRGKITKWRNFHHVST